MSTAVERAGFWDLVGTAIQQNVKNIISSATIWSQSDKLRVLDIFVVLIIIAIVVAVGSWSFRIGSGSTASPKASYYFVTHFAWRMTIQDVCSFRQSRMESWRCPFLMKRYFWMIVSTYLPAGRRQRLVVVVDNDERIISTEDRPRLFRKSNAREKLTPTTTTLK